MSPATVEKRRAVLINVAYIALVLGAFYLFMKYAFWTVAPFVFAFLVAAALQRPTNFISKKTHIKKGIVSVIAVLLIISLLITIVALTGARVVSEVKGLASTLTEWLKKLPDYVKSWETSLYRFTERLPDGLQSSAEDAIKSFSDKLLLSSEDVRLQRAQGSEQSQYQSFVYPQDSAQRRLVNREADSEYFGRRAPVYYRRLLHDRRI